MGTNCAPLVADLFLYCYERDFMLGLNPDSPADVIHAFNDTSRYLDDIFNIDNPYFDKMRTSIYPKELQSNKANNSNISAAFLDLDLAINNGIVSSKICYKRDDFNFRLTILILTEMYHVLHHTGFTFHNYFDLIGPVLSMRISVIAILLLLKSSSNTDTGTVRHGILDSDVILCLHFKQYWVFNVY